MSNLFNQFSNILKPKAFEFVGVKNLRFDALNNGILPLNLTIILKNPNNLNIHLEKINIEMSAWGTKLGGALQSPEQEIVANDTFNLDLKLNLIAEALQSKLKDDFLNILTQGNVIIPLRINGKASIKKFGFCIDVPLDITKDINLELNALLSKINF